jgi:hypothetical protein
MTDQPCVLKSSICSFTFRYNIGIWEASCTPAIQHTARVDPRQEFFPAFDASPGVSSFFDIGLRQMKAEGSKERAVGVWNDAAILAEVVQFDSQLVPRFQMEHPGQEYTVECSDVTAVERYVDRATPSTHRHTMADKIMRIAQNATTNDLSGSGTEWRDS